MRIPFSLPASQDLGLMIFGISKLEIVPRRVFIVPSNALWHSHTLYPLSPRPCIRTLASSRLLVDDDWPPLELRKRKAPRIETTLNKQLSSPHPLLSHTIVSPNIHGLVHDRKYSTTIQTANCTFRLRINCTILTRGTNYEYQEGIIPKGKYNEHEPLNPHPRGKRYYLLHSTGLTNTSYCKKQ